MTGTAPWTCHCAKRPAEVEPATLGVRDRLSKRWRIEFFDRAAPSTEQLHASAATCNLVSHQRHAAPGAGWAPFGFGRDQLMPETDVFVAGDSAGAGYSQDLTLLGAHEAGGPSRSWFSRPLNTVDTADVFN